MTQRLLAELEGVIVAPEKFEAENYFSNSHPITRKIQA